jgi:uncharacterized integral membrane protein (TIGR00698 family)
MTSLRTLMPGLLLSIALAACAAVLGTRFPLIGAPIFAIALGIVVRSFVTAPALSAGVAFASRTMLQTGIVLLGFGLNLAVVWSAGASSFPVLAGSLAVGLLGGLLLGQLMRIGFNIRMLVAAGTSICGASAIAAIAPILDAESGDVAFATATIFLYNIVAVFLFPPLGHALHMTQTVFGTWAGTAINDTSSVVAAGYAFGPVAGVTATIVKLTRALAILPLAVGIAIYVGSRGASGAARFNFVKVMPWFVVLFALAAAVASIGIVPATVLTGLAVAGKYIMVVAFAGVGLASDFKRLRSVGAAPLVLGLIVWALVAVVSLVVQRVLWG